MTTGEIIKALIKKRCLNQRKVASMAGCPAQTITKIIRNDVRGGDAYNSVCDALGVPAQIIALKTLEASALEAAGKVKEMSRILDEIDEMFDCKIDE